MQNCMTSNIVWQAVEDSRGQRDNGAMPRKSRASPKPKRAATQIRAWRKHRDLTLEKLAERLMIEQELIISDGQLSRIERGEQGYTQDLLEALAYVLRAAPADLIMRDPKRPTDPLQAMISEMSEPERQQAVAVIQALRRTGTSG